MLKSSSKLYLMLLLCFQILTVRAGVWQGKDIDVRTESGAETFKEEMIKYYTDRDSLIQFMQFLDEEIKQYEEDEVNYVILWNYYLNKGILSSQEMSFVNSYIEKAFELAYLRDDKKRLLLSELQEGNAYFRKGFYRLAIYKYDSALGFSAEVNEPDFDYEIYHNTGICLNKLGEYQSSLEHFEKAIAIRREQGRESELGLLYNNLGTVYNNLENQEKALEFYHKSLDLLEKSGKRRNLALVHNNIGNVHMFNKNFEPALLHFKKSLELKKANSPGYAVTLNNIGLLYSERDSIKALQYFKQAEKLCRENSYMMQLATVYDSFTEHYEALNNYDKASKYLRLGDTVKDSLYNEEMHYLQQDAKNIYLIMGKSREIEELEYENRLKDSNLQLNRSIYVFALVLILTMILFAVFLLRRRYIRKKQYEDLKEKNRMLEEKQKKQHVLLEMQQKLQKQLESRIKTEIEHVRNKDSMILIQSRHSAVGEMIGNIAHQWRQPINAIGILIQDFADAYEYGELNDDYFNKKMKLIDDLIGYMDHTIDDFKNFFNPAKEKKVFAAGDILNRALEFVSCTFNSRNINYEIDMIDEFNVFGTPNELFQVILNILNNARDAFYQQKTDSPMLHVKMYIEYDMGCISILDNAGGISSQVIDTLFEPYITTKSEIKGTGMGLYIVKNIVERNFKGKVKAVNEVKGANFIIKLPLADSNS